MILSQTAEYALRAVLHIAEHGVDRPVSVSDMAQALDVPRNYLSKTLHQLSRAGVVTSTYGPGGGFQLSSSPDRLTLEVVVAPFEETGRRHCLLGRAKCADSNPCTAHEHWKGISERIRTFFATTTIATLLSQGGDVPILSAPRKRAARTR
jgi:Rrf2 family protein